MKGKIPPTAKIKLESEEFQWRLLINKLINELKTSALLERTPGNQVRIRLVIKEIIPPENLRGKNICRTESNLNQNVSIGFSRSREFLNDFIGEKIWLFIGYIDGEERTPIVVTYYEVIDIMIYTQKLISEETKSFFPNAGLN